MVVSLNGTSAVGAIGASARTSHEIAASLSEISSRLHEIAPDKIASYIDQQNPGFAMSDESDIQRSNLPASLQKEEEIVR